MLKVVCNHCNSDNIQFIKHDSYTSLGYMESSTTYFDVYECLECKKEFKQNTESKYHG